MVGVLVTTRKLTSFLDVADLKKMQAVTRTAHVPQERKTIHSAKGHGAKSEWPKQKINAELLQPIPYQCGFYHEDSPLLQGDS